jgi:sugar phosphate isomerase/epimerase
MDKRIGAQYFTLRDYMKSIEDFDATCKKISEIGYKIVQISASPLGAKEMREVLDKYNLEVVTTHRSFDDFLKDPEEIISYNKTLGSNLCGVGMMPARYCEDIKSIREFIKEANRICEIFKKENVYFAYHNHAFEFAKMDGKLIFDCLTEETDPEMFNFIVDTYWVQVGGKNPAAVIEKLGKRAMAVHFKDFAVNKDNWQVPEMAEVGEGNLDWDSIIKACDVAGTKWALVEQDVCKRSPFESMEMSYNYLKTKGFC